MRDSEMVKQLVPPWVPTPGLSMLVGAILGIALTHEAWWILWGALWALLGWANWVLVAGLCWAAARDRR